MEYNNFTLPHSICSISLRYSIYLACCVQITQSISLTQITQSISLCTDYSIYLAVPTVYLLDREKAVVSFPIIVVALSSCPIILHLSYPSICQLEKAKGTIYQLQPRVYCMIRIQYRRSILNDIPWPNIVLSVS